MSCHSQYIYSNMFKTFKFGQFVHVKTVACTGSDFTKHEQTKTGWLTEIPAITMLLWICHQLSGDTEVSGWLCNCVALEIERIPLIPHALF